jgi:hypothetical protein
MQDVFEKISRKVKSALVPSRVLLSKFRFLDEQSRYSRACQDDHYLPFFYYLGVNYPAKSVLDFGFGLGINSSIYFMGNKNVENYLAIQEKPTEYYSSRLGIANVKQIYKNPFYVHVGEIYDDKFMLKLKQRKWDLVFLNEKSTYDRYLFCLNTIWDHIEENGLICIDYVNNHEFATKAYEDFCLIKNRKSHVFETRYGVGTIIR